MRIWRWIRWRTSMLALAGGLIAPAAAGDFQLISARDPGQAAPAGGAGDSAGPSLSADGRYVLFASTANNLLATSNHTPLPGLFPARLNVFLRDRSNAITTLVSVNLAGAGGGNGDSLPVEVSTNGQYILFESSASDLVAQDTNSATDVFVRDLVNGTTLLVSVSTNGSVGNGASRNAAMTPDGRYVAFVSAANNLVPGDTNRIPDVFVRDLQAGATVLASAGAVSTNRTAQFPDGSSEAPDLTPDGRYVAFSSTATNLVAGVGSAPNIYLRDLVSGNTIWASSYARTAVPSNSLAVFNRAISADGKYVAYEAAGKNASLGTVLRYSLDSGQTDKVHTNAAVATAAYEDIFSLEITPDGRFLSFVANTNGTTGTTTCVLQWDGQTGAASLVSAALDGSATAGATCDWPTMDASGRFISFLSSATNLVTNSVAGDYHVYVRDMQSGTTVLADADTNGAGSIVSPAAVPRLSADGRYVAFECADGNLVANDRNHDADVFVRDLSTGGSELISAHDPSLPSLSANGPCLLSAGSLSVDGRYVAFASDADNLAANDTNACRDVFVHDRGTGSNTLVSVSTNGFSGDAPASEPSISAEGRYVAFTSLADNLVAGDTNKAQDVFLRDLQTATTTLVSVNTGGTGPANRDSYAASVSADGKYVLFHSKASNLAAGSFTGVENLFLRDRQAGITYALTAGGMAQASMTPDGHWVVLLGNIGAGAGVSNLYVWSTALAMRVYTNALDANSAWPGLALSPDGQRSAYGAISNGVGRLYGADLAARTNGLIDSGAATSYPGVRLSREGWLLAYAKKTTNLTSITLEIRLYDFLTGTNLLLSQSRAPLGTPFGAANLVDFSPDNRFVAYRGPVTNVVAGVTNVYGGIFLYDRQSASNRLVTLNGPGDGPANNWSFAPVFSGDGQTLACASWASELAPLDFNHSSDLFAFTLLYASVTAPASGQGPWISWPYVPDKTYHVQFKDLLNGGEWQEVGGTINLVGTKAWLQDTAPGSGQRYYRVVAD